MWTNATPDVPQALLFGQFGTPTELANRKQISKLAHRATPARYLHDIDENHIMVRETETYNPRRVRCVKFQPYHSATDPVSSSTYATKAFALHHTPTQVTCTKLAPAHPGQAKKYPDAAEWEKVCNAELDNLGAMNVVR